MKPAVNHSVLMCHAPIVIEEIAGPNAPQVAKSNSAMKHAAMHVLKSQPDALVIVSPHVPRYPGSFSIHVETQLQGSFRQFSFSHLNYNYKNHRKGVSLILEAAASFGVDMQAIDTELDHGTMVPLEFCKSAGWQGPLIVIGFPYQPSLEQTQALGKLIHHTAQKLGESWNLVASGDMSHRLKEGAPSGYHPEAGAFDDYIVDAVKSNQFKKVFQVDPGLRQIAAEDVVDSLSVADGFHDSKIEACEYLSYERPFGVGYLIANLV